MTSHKDLLQAYKQAKQAMEIFSDEQIIETLESMQPHLDEPYVKIAYGSLALYLAGRSLEDEEGRRGNGGHN